MDRNFIARNQIVERYLGGKLPLRGAQDFERYCKDHPELLDEIGLTERLNAALRLLEAGGHAPPWETRTKPWWEKLPVLLGTAALALILSVVVLVLVGKVAERNRSIAGLQQQLAARSLDPALATRSVPIMPSREGIPAHSQATIGGAQTEMADIKIDLAWAPFAAYRVIIDRVDQGRVGIIYNAMRDSNGALHLGLNSSALGPGEYLLTFQGLTWRGEPVPTAWTLITIAR
ncbi:MAG: hypothetical protein WB646_08450 [Steroidobacteraceae bacterium]